MTIVTRRAILGAGAALVSAPGRARSQTGPADEVIDLWPSDPPGRTDARIVRKVTNESSDPATPGRAVTGIERPALVVRRPARPNGTAVLVVPGGGYEYVSYDKEGMDQAAWLNALGVTAFVLLYRLPAEGWQRREDVPLQDAQRAMRLIRAHATRFAIRADRVAVLGFSAGGHLAGWLATRHAENVYAPVDAADRLSACPDAAGLLYPVISLDARFAHAGSRDHLLGPDATQSARRARSVELCVDARTPPVFLAHAADDGAVPVANGIAMFEAMKAAARPTALHVFEEGGHGFGVRLPRTMPASAWPTLFAAFAARHGFFPETGA
jgi:acetyl esterase/lipase